MSCPLPVETQEIITLAHGSGGKLTSQLIETIFLPAFSNPHLKQLHDGAILELPQARIAFTTDSYVIQPLFFPGGDIGKLAVTGTLNDLAMCAARPLFLSCGFIIEEGFLTADLKRIVNSMQAEAKRHSASIVTGDTKVIERQSGQNLFINTSAIGIKMQDEPTAPSQIQPGDALIISGDIGRHGIAVMAEREGLECTEPLISDCASLFPIVEALLQSGIQLHCLRDLTRGGLSTTLVELAESSGKEFVIEEERIPVSTPVHSVCEILGIDPLYVASEGRFVAFVPSHQAQLAVQIIRRFAEGAEAAWIGKVSEKGAAPCAKIKTPLDPTAPFTNWSQTNYHVFVETVYGLK